VIAFNYQIQLRSQRDYFQALNRILEVTWLFFS